MVSRTVCPTIDDNPLCEAWPLMSLTSHSDDRSLASRPDTCADDHILVLRAIDACTNRLLEALRTVEDVTRFILDDRWLTRQIKDTRHEASALVRAVVPRDQLVSARDTQNDAGKDTKALDELSRANVQALLDANFNRAQQSLRSLEEHFKLVCPGTASNLEHLRYHIYTVEKIVSCITVGRRVLQDVTIYALIDADEYEARFTQRIETLIESGVDAIQLRDKSLDDRALLCRARRLVELSKESEVLTFVNDRPDIARLANSTGVHLGQEDLPVHEARRILHSTQLIGVSTHGWAQATEAVVAGAHYLGIGPIFPSRTKAFAEFVDESTLQKVFREISLPVFAIGGINGDNVASVADLGGSRIALSSGLNADAEDLRRTVRDLRQALSRTHSVVDHVEP